MNFSGRPGSGAAAAAKRRGFTLIEIVVAVAIIVMMCSIAMTFVRGQSPRQQLEQATREFQGFCSQVRFCAAEQGREWVVYFDEDENAFLAAAANAPVLRLPDSQTTESDSGPDPVEAARYAAEEMHRQRRDSTKASAKPLIECKLPENIRFSLADANDREETFPELNGRREICRFYADGSGGGGFKMTFQYDEILAQTFHLSPLTGLLIGRDGDAAATREFSLEKTPEN